MWSENGCISYGGTLYKSTGQNKKNTMHKVEDVNHLSPGMVVVER